MTLKMFDVVEGIFFPTIDYDIRLSDRRFIGKEFKFQALWIIDSKDDEFGGRYIGQWALYAMGFRHKAKKEWPTFIWLPEEDVEITRRVRSGSI